MLNNYSPDQLRMHLNGLLALDKENETVEFKRNPDWEELGKYISALANSAAFLEHESAYLIYGVDDKTHQIVGTQQLFSKATHKGQEVESWLLQKLTPKTEFRVHEFTTETEVPVMIVEIMAAKTVPIKFDGEEWIRVGSYTKKLRDYPEKERGLWRTFEHKTFEQCMAMENVSAEQVVHLLSTESYFDMMHLPLPESRQSMLEKFIQDGLVQKQINGLYAITNLGAICFAKSLRNFSTLSRKAVRVIRYEDKSRINTEKEILWEKGYAVDFDGLIQAIQTLLPSREVIGEAYRRSERMYPDITIRELVANAIIHQDFFMTGTGPMVEIFQNRIEISNPGRPLVEIPRLLDSPPRSRNEVLAALMRRMDICEERGSGIDKVVAATEVTLLPAPQFEEVGNNLRVILFGYKPFKDLSVEERGLICYMHSVLKYVNREQMTNSSLRERFGIDAKNSATISRVIKDCISKGLIKPFDPNVGSKLMRYVPYWA